jgi:hypothetical protein
LKISDSFDKFAMEIEIPMDQEVYRYNEEKFVKLFKGKLLSREIDRLHGIDVTVCSWTDCILRNLQKSGGTTSARIASIF